MEEKLTEGEEEFLLDDTLVFFVDGTPMSSTSLLMKTRKTEMSWAREAMREEGERWWGTYR